MTSPTLARIAFATLLVFAPILISNRAHGQVSSTERGMAFGMLDMTKDAIKKNYYDPTFHGIDVDFVFEQAKERIKNAPTRDSMMITIASAVLALDDSHTNFFPPSRAAEIEYGWVVGMVGDDCYVTHVKPKSDAEAKGLKVGDKLLAIDGFKPTRKNLWQMYYRYFTIAPTPKVTMTLLSPADTKPHVLEIQTKIARTGSVVSLRELYERGAVRHGWEDSERANEFEQFGNNLLIWKMHTFSQPEEDIDLAFGKAKDCKWLILDLRDNGGGYEDVLKRMIGHLFDKDVTLGGAKTRKETKPIVAKGHGEGAFKGDLIVLINHDSASASEIFSRVVQMEKRGKIIGDRSMGAVMRSRFYPLESGIGNDLWFGATVTVADLIMGDGVSLEKVGVTPDETVLPKAKDIAELKDPVLSYAANLAGIEITPEKAGSFFPYVWPKP